MARNLWTTQRQAIAAGYSVRGLLFGVVPGFYDPEADAWRSRSDLLRPVEMMAARVWGIFADVTGRDPAPWVLGRAMVETVE